jgi:hypothetical protein
MPVFRSSAVLSALLWFTATAATITVPGNGTPTPAAALDKAKIGDTVMVADGAYKGSITVPVGVVLCAKNTLGAIIDGGGRGKTVTLKNGSVIQGFQIVNGTIGVYVASPGGAVQRCRIAKMAQSGIMCLGQLPHIEDNVIAFNGGSGIQGWDAQSASAAISHNTIAFNENNGITLGGNTKVIIENNIISNNRRFAVKQEEKALITLVRNNFFNNSDDQQFMVNNNMSVDPQFVVPYRLNFQLQENSKGLGAATDGTSLGARLPAQDQK